jgi:formylglycine-generating enzyme required for sulfatase activity
LGMKFAPAPGTKVLFCIHETRYRDFVVFQDDTKRPLGEQWKNQSFGNFSPTLRREDHPVTSVSWSDAAAFCKWISEKEGRTYRLPTDREWSCAVLVSKLEDAYAGLPRKELVLKIADHFPWGNNWPPAQRVGNFCDESYRTQFKLSDAVLATYNDGFPTTSPVMSFPSNSLGIYDLAGNVAEWCEDAWEAPFQRLHIVRGSHWQDTIRTALLSSNREMVVKEQVSGFRVVIENE